jgi:hypothetical protein
VQSPSSGSVLFELAKVIVVKIILIILTTITLASSNNEFPDDGDYTETCWSCFNENFNILLKQLSCASVGK